MADMEDYTTLLTGGGKMMKGKAKQVVGGKMKKEGKAKQVGGKMTYEDRLKNLEKARAVRMANLEKKKSSMKGKGNYTQDYVDESQVNYAGSPLDMYYLETKKEEKKQKKKRGEIGGGKLSQTDEMRIDAILGGKMKKSMKKEIMEEMDDMDGGAMNYDIPEAIRILAELASKFGLKLMK
jgi:hypothetical protein